MSLSAKKTNSIESSSKPIIRDHWFWPDVSTMDLAKVACSNAAKAGFFCAGLTIVLSFIAQALQGAWLDITFIMVCSTFLILKQSRVAAVILFSVFILGKLIQLDENPHMAKSLLVTAIPFSVFFLNGVRGSFAFQSMKKLQTNTSKTIATDSKQSRGTNFDSSGPFVYALRSR